MCTAMLNENTYRAVYETRVCLVKHLVENTCITLTEMLSKNT